MTNYNLAWTNQSNNLFTIVDNVNTETGFILGPFLLLMVFIVLFAMWKNYDTLVALLTSSSITFMISIYLWSIGFIGLNVLIIPFIILIGTIVLMFIR